MSKDNKNTKKITQPPIEELPVEQPPIEELPVEQPPIEELPVEQTPIEEPELSKSERVKIAAQKYLDSIQKAADDRTPKVEEEEAE